MGKNREEVSRSERRMNWDIRAEMIGSGRPPGRCSAMNMLELICNGEEIGIGAFAGSSSGRRELKSCDVGCSEKDMRGELRTESFQKQRWKRN